MKYENLIVECRRQWNRFDPIGVIDAADETDDEYHSYAARTAKLLMEGADARKVADYVRNVLHSLGIFRDPGGKDAGIRAATDASLNLRRPESGEYSTESRDALDVDSQRLCEALRAHVQ